jgi:hypothetical protein
VRNGRKVLRGVEKVLSGVGEAGAWWGVAERVVSSEVYGGSEGWREEIVPARLGWGEVYPVSTYSRNGEDTFCSRTTQAQIN